MFACLQATSLVAGHEPVHIRALQADHQQVAGEATYIRACEVRCEVCWDVQLWTIGGSAWATFSLKLVKPATGQESGSEVTINARHRLNSVCEHTSLSAPRCDKGAHLQNLPQDSGCQCSSRVSETPALCIVLHTVCASAQP